MKALTVLQRLLVEPARFTFDAAVRVLLHRQHTADPADAMRFHTRTGMAYPGSDILSVELPSPPPAAEDRDGTPAATTISSTDARPAVTVGLLGLAGASGVLPRYYNEQLVSASQEAARDLQAFLDIMGHRMLGAFAQAGIKYRLDRSVEAARLADGASPAAHEQTLLAIAGFGDVPELDRRLGLSAGTLLYYAGLFAMRPRSTERLVALASDWLGRPVEAREFSGAWLRIQPDQRTRLPSGRRPGMFCRLGYERRAGAARADDQAALGVRAWDQQARVVLRVGPLNQADFHGLLPHADTRALICLVALVRAYLGSEVSFAVNLVVSGDQVPRLQFARDRRPEFRLGWNTWLDLGKSPTRRPPNRDDARFGAEAVEAFHGARLATTARQVPAE